MKIKVNKHKPYMLLVFLIFVFAVAFLGNLFVGDGVNSDWYDSIRPSITPPDWTFGVVWPILYILIAVSLYLAWINVKDNKQESVLFIVFGINLIANGLWSCLFFNLKSPLFAFFDLIFIWITIILMMFYTWKLNRRATYLLIPYFLWVSFAGVLNFMAYINSI